MLAQEMRQALSLPRRRLTDHQYRYLLAQVVGLDPLDEFLSVHHRHVHIGDDETKHLCGPENGDRFLAVSGHRDVVEAETHQQEGDDVDEDIVVFDHEYLVGS